MSPLVYLVLTSARNRVLVAVRRLREPKYLFGMLAAFAYFWFFVFGPISKARTGGASPFRIFSEHADIGLSLGALLLLLALVSAWLLPNKRAALRFTESEVNVLFPAPLPHRTLVHYKLLKLQLAALLTVVVFTAISAFARGSALSLLSAFAWWLLLNLLQLHGIGSSFAREWLLQRGVADWKRRALVGTVLSLAAGGSLAWLWLGSGTIAWGRGPLGWLGFVNEALSTGPLNWLLTPFRWLVKPLLAVDAAEFFLWIWPLLGLVVLHYWWVLKCAVGFEEASVELAEKSARRLETVLARANRGLPISLKARPDPWTLRSDGPPELALSWKNLTLLGNWGRPSRLPTLLGIAVALGYGIGAYAPFLIDSMAGSIAVVLFVFTLFSGGQMLRFDLRQDVEHMDILKTLPLSGAQMVRGQLLAPVWTLFTWQFVLLAFAFPILACNKGGAEFLFDKQGWVLWPLCLLVAPLLNALNFLLANALFMLFPAWYRVDAQNAAGFARMGQGLIQMLFQSVLMLVVLVPTGACLFVFGFAGVRLLGGGWGALVGIVPAAIMLCAAIWFFIDAVGRDFEEFDLAKELR